MASPDADIPWPVLQDVVRDGIGTAAELVEATPLAGGCVNAVLRLTLADGTRAVVKLVAHRSTRAFADEAYQLGVLRDLGLPVPAVYAFRVGSLAFPHSYLLMEHVAGVDLATAKRLAPAEAYDALQCELAEQVLALHAVAGPQYSRVLADESPAFASWPAFYAHCFEPIWRHVESESLLPIKSRKRIGKIHDALDRLLAHDDCPRLCHADLWATNLIVADDGTGRWRVAAFLDPNCKFAHCESELAYLELFQTITAAFMRTYQRHRPLPPEYQQVRKSVYQLYELLNHVRLFGPDYVTRTVATAERLARVV